MTRRETPTATQATGKDLGARLADALEQGSRFRVQIGGERICVPARALCSIEHEREGAHEEIEFQVTWTNP